MRRACCGSRPGCWGAGTPLQTRWPRASSAPTVTSRAAGSRRGSARGCIHGRTYSDAQDAGASRPGSVAEGVGGPRMNVIDQRVHQALDGELAAEAVPAELRHAVARLAAAAELLAAPPPGPAASLQSRVMAAIRRPAPSRARRVMRWLVTPHAIILRVRPAWSVAFAAVVATLTLFTAGDQGPELEEHEGIAQFVGRFPEAQSVHVVGTFNDWRPGSIALEDQDHDGVWRATVVLPAGTYEYMFVVDGERWVPDHLEDRLVADDFGRENSIVIVRPARR